MVKVPRRTEGGNAPAWQGVTREHTGSIRLNNAVRADAASAECNGYPYLALALFRFAQDALTFSEMTFLAAALSFRRFRLALG